MGSYWTETNDSAAAGDKECDTQRPGRLRLHL